MIETTKLNILISVWMTLTFFKVTVLWGIKNCVVHFFRNFTVGLNEFQYVATICCFVEAHAKFILYK